MSCEFLHDFKKPNINVTFIFKFFLHNLEVLMCITFSSLRCNHGSQFFNASLYQKRGKYDQRKSPNIKNITITKRNQSRNNQTQNHTNYKQLLNLVIENNHMTYC